MSQIYHNYTQEELKEMQRINLEMAVIFFDFCKERNLTAYFCGGGCIGAIRHGGFIPWDDDLDFFMPRKDYEAFVSLWNTYEPGSELALSDSDENFNDHNLFATLRHRETTYIKPYQKQVDMVHGVQLDIIPLDGYPDGKWQRKMQCMWALIYSLFRAQTIPVKHGGVLALGIRLFLGLFRGKKLRYRIWKFAKKKMTKYDISECKGITELCSGPGYMKNWYDKEWFDHYILKDFEGRKMPLPVGYDAYLRTAFGNYMELPKEEDRVSHHDCVYLDLKHSYKKYRGIYYMTEEA